VSQDPLNKRGRLSTRTESYPEVSARVPAVVFLNYGQVECVPSDCRCCAVVQGRGGVGVSQRDAWTSIPPNLDPL
jgi:hypothetical protein